MVVLPHMPLVLAVRLPVGLGGAVDDDEDEVGRTVEVGLAGGGGGAAEVLEAGGGGAAELVEAGGGGGAAELGVGSGWPSHQPNAVWQPTMARQNWSPSPQ